MRHWLLRANLLLGVILGISIPLFSTAVNLLNRIDPIAPIVSQEQKSRPQPLSLPPASRLSSLSKIPHAIERRGGIHIQELGPDLRLQYHVFRVSSPQEIAMGQDLSYGEKRIHLLAFLPILKMLRTEHDLSRHSPRLGPRRPVSQNSGTNSQWSSPTFRSTSSAKR